jgi:hypothetical protein
MTTSKHDNNIYQNFSFSKPAIYEIKVLGEVNLELSDRLQRMQISIDRKSGPKPVSILIGRMNDQAALSGVLNTLFDMHLTVISVDVLK